MEEARRLLSAVSDHPDVTAAEVAGSLRRKCETARDVDIVAACSGDPAEVAASFARAPGVRNVAAVNEGGRAVSIDFVDGARFDLYCETPDRFAVALCRATGSTDHVTELESHLARHGYKLDGNRLLNDAGREQAVPDEKALYAAAGLRYIEPELREGWGEIEAAAQGTLPRLIEFADVKGALHCHSSYSDGVASVEEMAAGARARGWKYVGITDHSQAAFYAGGMSRDNVERQLAEIDELNARSPDVRVLKGIEADILADGRVDYDEEVLSRFDYVIGSVHSRFAMDGAAMTARVLSALDDPHLTILGHPTGRLLLTREGYSIDMTAVIEKAAETGTAIELNADPQRLDIDWRSCRVARDRGVTVEIGPDAHSTRGLDNIAIGIGIARKGWLESGDVLNTRDAEGVLEFARQRRSGAGRRG
jgi:DNA polymerase (family 10)